MDIDAYQPDGRIPGITIPFSTYMGHPFWQGILEKIRLEFDNSSVIAKA